MTHYRSHSDPEATLTSMFRNIALLTQFLRRRFLVLLPTLGKPFFLHHEYPYPEFPYTCRSYELKYHVKNSPKGRTECQFKDEKGKSDQEQSCNCF